MRSRWDPQEWEQTVGLETQISSGSRMTRSLLVFLRLQKYCVLSLIRTGTRCQRSVVNNLDCPAYRATLPVADVARSLEEIFTAFSDLDDQIHVLLIVHDSWSVLETSLDL